METPGYSQQHDSRLWRLPGGSGVWIWASLKGSRTQRRAHSRLDTHSFMSLLCGKRGIFLQRFLPKCSRFSSCPLLPSAFPSSNFPNVNCSVTLITVEKKKHIWRLAFFLPQFIMSLKFNRLNPLLWDYLKFEHRFVSTCKTTAYPRKWRNFTQHQSPKLKFEHRGFHGICANLPKILSAQMHTDACMHACTHKHLKFPW